MYKILIDSFIKITYSRFIKAEHKVCQIKRINSCLSSIQVYIGPQKSEYKSGSVTNVGPPPHSKGHIFFFYLYGLGPLAFSHSELILKL
jgi:hypothetical protein